MSENTTEAKTWKVPVSPKDRRFLLETIARAVAMERVSKVSCNNICIGGPGMSTAELRRHKRIYGAMFRREKKAILASMKGFAYQEILPLVAVIFIIAGLLLIPLAHLKKKSLARKATREAALLTNQPPRLATTNNVFILTNSSR